MKVRTRIALGAASAVLLAGVLVGAATSDDDTGRGPGLGPSVYDPATLHGAYDMTQYMGRPDSTGAMFGGLLVDQQLRLSRDPAFVAELEQHQAEIDRMLGRGTP